ncbi:hypothetical protein [Nisaea sp.]|uniref:hypothetical protein n=1 Tax=Nisaea sp. TaxID=2024842 RepID=UPI003B52E75C
MRRNAARMSWSRLFLAMTIALSATGCVTVTVQRDFQTTLSEVAEEENRLRYGAPEPFGPVEKRMVLQKYHDLVVSIDALDSGQIAALRADRLYANTLALKAIALWRLGRHDGAEAARAEALTEAPDPRDRLFLDTLPGLIANDQAFAEIALPVPQEPSERTARYDRIEERLWFAYRSFERSLAEMRATQLAGESLETYLLISSLGSFANLKNAYGRLIDPETFPLAATCMPAPVMVDLASLRCDMHLKLERLEAAAGAAGIEEAGSFTARWRNATGITGAPAGCTPEVEVAERRARCP